MTWLCNGVKNCKMKNIAPNIPSYEISSTTCETASRKYIPDRSLDFSADSTQSKILPYPTQYGGAKFGLWLPVFVIFSKQFQFFASVHPFCTSFEYFPQLFCIFSAQNLPAAYPAAYTGYPLKRYYLLLRNKELESKCLIFFWEMFLNLKRSACSRSTK